MQSHHTNPCICGCGALVALPKRAKNGHNPRPHLTVEERFWAKVDTSGDCWRWTAGIADTGYGIFHVSKTPRLMLGAHRFAWETASGAPIPGGQHVLHVCDDRACVRNDEVGIYVVGDRILPRLGHLFLGTRADNMADMIEKGRGGAITHPERLSRGEAHYLAKVTDEVVRQIRCEYRRGVTGQTLLAKRYGLGRSTVAHIVNRESWKHI